MRPNLIVHLIITFIYNPDLVSGGSFSVLFGGR